MEVLRRRVRRSSFDVDARAGEGADHVGDRHHGPVDRESLRTERLPAGEGEELSGELGRPVDRLGDGADIPTRRSSARLGRLSRSVDDLMTVRRLLKFAPRPGQLADRLQLLGLAKLFLEGPALGDVTAAA